MLAFTVSTFAQLPDLGGDVEPPKKSDEIYPALVLVGLLNEFPARNAVEVNDGLFAHFYESQEIQFQIAHSLLGNLLKSKGFKGNVEWKLESNKGKSIYSPEGVQLLNQYFKPFSTGQGILKNEIFVERVGNYFDFTPRETFLEGEENPSRSTMLSLLSGFLLRAQEDDQIHASDTTFTRKMLEFMLLEGCVFDSFRIHVAIPQTIHLKLRPAESLSLAMTYVSERREAVEKKPKAWVQE